jgi:hypothetical protein
MTNYWAFVIDNTLLRRTNALYVRRGLTKSEEFRVVHATEPKAQ